MSMETTPVIRSRALPVSVVARRLCLSERSVYRAIARGELEAVRIGRSVRVSEAVLARLLQPRETT
jgi:excisionase family DNA binding protein